MSLPPLSQEFKRALVEYKYHGPHPSGWYYVFPVPPVSTGLWGTDSWVHYIDNCKGWRQRCVPTH